MIVRESHAHVGILGAGIMGCCLALELARRGHLVDLIDLAPTPMTRASLHNEGKLHLGFVYAKDPLRTTHLLMLRGSLVFTSILEKLTGCTAEALGSSKPFHYFVPIDSQLDMASIHQHFQEVETAILAETQASGNLYLGSTFERYFERNTDNDHSRLFSAALTQGSFRTEERSVSTAAVADILCQTVRNRPGINFIGNTEIRSVTRLDNGEVRVAMYRDGEVSFRTYACVANCLWEDKLRIDRTAGVTDQGDWIMRYKAMISISAPEVALSDIPSSTGILGTYGDVVNHGNGSYYISWYPLCKLAQSFSGEGRQLYEAVHAWALPRYIRKNKSRFPSLAKFIASFTHKKFIKDNLLEMAAYIPSLANLVKTGKRCEVGGGIILARGSTDIDDTKSYLHQRSAIGPVAHGSYVTIDTGKYCTAPMFALEAAEMIEKIVSD